MSDDTKTYNGWTNYETWNVKLWIDNEEGDYRYWLERVAEIKEENTDDCESCAGTGMQADVDEPCPKCEGTGHVVDIDAARYALMTALKDWVEERNPIGDQASMYSDLLGAAISEVNWYEIAQAMLEDD